MQVSHVLVLGKVLTISEPQFPQMWDGYNDRAYFLGFYFFRIKLKNMYKAFFTKPVTQQALSKWQWPLLVLVYLLLLFNDKWTKHWKKSYGQEKDRFKKKDWTYTEGASLQRTMNDRLRQRRDRKLRTLEEKRVEENFCWCFVPVPSSRR